MFNSYMHMAIKQAEAALAKGEVPVGAVVVKNGKIISEGYNLRETTNNAVAHAEIIAIRKACEALNTWRLDDCDIYVTLEPCVMCSGAIMNARIRNVYFGSYDKNSNAFESVLRCCSQGRLPTVYGGIMEDECNSILKKFFKNIRE